MTVTSLTKYLTTHLEFIRRAGGSNGSDGGDFEDLEISGWLSGQVADV